MTTAITCPGCGAPLSHPGGRATARCPYCGVAVAVAPPPPADAPAPPARDRQVPDPTLAPVAELLRADKRVQATILYRQITGATLKAARLAIDRFLAGEQLRRPEPF